MASFQPGNQYVPTVNTLTITAASAAALATAINAQTNTLNKLIIIPAMNAQGTAQIASGTVYNDSIKISETRVFVINNVPTYFATVSWMQNIITS